ncbi:hypothetical protein Q3G72_026639 [Acer saccharum]|nr:hypothetical protein Q3G72_026639 [Acer saccharum]
MNSGQLFSFLVLFLFLFSNLPYFKYSDRPADFPTINQDEKVDMFLYYESLCPGCAAFNSKDLVQVFEKGGWTAVGGPAAAGGGGSTTEAIDGGGPVVERQLVRQRAEAISGGPAAAAVGRRRRQSTVVDLQRSGPVNRRRRRFTVG